MKPAWTTNARCGRIYRHMHLQYWACEGLIAIHDDRDDSYGVILPKVFLRHAKALENMIGPKPSEGNAAVRTLWKECCRAITEMRDACRDATEMGDPSDPKVQAHWRLHKPGSKSRVSLSSGSNANGYPALPQVDVGRYTGRTAEVDGLANIPPNDYRLHHPPRRKNRAGLILNET